MHSRLILVAWANLLIYAGAFAQSIGNYILNFFLLFLLHSAVLSACQYVGSTAPTVLPIRKAPLV